MSADELLDANPAFINGTERTRKKSLFAKRRGVVDGLRNVSQTVTTDDASEETFIPPLPRQNSLDALKTLDEERQGSITDNGVEFKSTSIPSSATPPLMAQSVDLKSSLLSSLPSLSQQSTNLIHNMDRTVQMMMQSFMRTNPFTRGTVTGKYKAGQWVNPFLGTSSSSSSSHSSRTSSSRNNSNVTTHDASLLRTGSTPLLPLVLDSSVSSGLVSVVDYDETDNSFTMYDFDHTFDTTRHTRDKRESGRSSDRESLVHTGSLATLMRSFTPPPRTHTQTEGVSEGNTVSGSIEMQFERFLETQQQHTQHDLSVLMRVIEGDDSLVASQKRRLISIARFYFNDKERRHVPVNTTDTDNGAVVVVADHVGVDKKVDAMSIDSLTPGVNDDNNNNNNDYNNNYNYNNNTNSIKSSHTPHIRMPRTGVGYYTPYSHVGHLHNRVTVRELTVSSDEEGVFSTPVQTPTHNNTTHTHTHNTVVRKRRGSVALADLHTKPRNSPRGGDTVVGVRLMDMTVKGEHIHTHTHADAGAEVVNNERGGSGSGSVDTSTHTQGSKHSEHHEDKSSDVVDDDGELLESVRQPRPTKSIEPTTPTTHPTINTNTTDTRSRRNRRSSSSSSSSSSSRSGGHRSGNERGGSDQSKSRSSRNSNSSSSGESSIASSHEEVVVVDTHAHPDPQPDETNADVTHTHIPLTHTDVVTPLKQTKLTRRLTQTNTNTNMTTVKQTTTTTTTPTPTPSHTGTVGRKSMFTMLKEREETTGTILAPHTPTQVRSRRKTHTQTHTPVDPAEVYSFTTPPGGNTLTDTHSTRRVGSGSVSGKGVTPTPLLPPTPTSTRLHSWKDTSRHTTHAHTHTHVSDGGGVDWSNTHNNYTNTTNNTINNNNNTNSLTTNVNTPTSAGISAGVTSLRRTRVVEDVDTPTHTYTEGERPQLTLPPPLPPLVLPSIDDETDMWGVLEAVLVHTHKQRKRHRHMEQLLSTQHQSREIEWVESKRRAHQDRVERMRADDERKTRQKDEEEREIDEERRDLMDQYRDMYAGTHTDTDVSTRNSQSHARNTHAPARDTHVYIRDNYAFARDVPVTARTSPSTHHADMNTSQSSTPTHAHLHTSTPTNHHGPPVGGYGYTATHTHLSASGCVCAVHVGFLRSMSSLIDTTTALVNTHTTHNTQPYTRTYSYSSPVTTMPVSPHGHYSPPQSQPQSPQYTQTPQYPSQSLFEVVPDTDTDVVTRKRRRGLHVASDNPEESYTHTTFTSTSSLDQHTADIAMLLSLVSCLEALGLGVYCRALLRVYNDTLVIHKLNIHAHTHTHDVLVKARHTRVDIDYDGYEVTAAQVRRELRRILAREGEREEDGSGVVTMVERVMDVMQYYEDIMSKHTHSRVTVPPTLHTYARQDNNTIIQ